MQAPQFEPMSVGGILDRTFLLYRRNIVRYVTIVALVEVPFNLALLALLLPFQRQALLLQRTAPNQDPAQTLWFFIGIMAITVPGWILKMMANGIANAALIRSVSESYLGREATVVEAYRFVWPRVGWVVLAALILGLGFALGWCMCFVPGLFVYLIFSLTMPALVVENLNPFQAIARSVQFVFGNFVKALSTVGVAGLIYAIVAAAFWGAGALLRLHLQDRTFTASLGIAQAITMIGPIVATPVLATAGILLYYDLRIRKEGFDLEMLAARLHGEKPSDGHLSGQ